MIYDTLNTAFESNEEVKLLKEQREEKKGQLFDLSDTKREVILNAQIGVLTRKIEEAIAMDDENQVGNLKSELATVQTEAESIVETKKIKRGEITIQIEEIESKLKKIAGKILNESFEAARREFTVKINEVLDGIEDVCTGHSTFAGEHKANFKLDKNWFRPHPSGYYGPELWRLYDRFKKLNWI